MFQKMKEETDIDTLVKTGKVKHLKKFWQMKVPGDAAEWFVDCYRMRVSDECEWYGTFRGLYEYFRRDGDKILILQDFLVFCKMARKHGVLRENENYEKILTIAAKKLCTGYCKALAKEQYDGENVYSGFQSGKPSLRLESFKILYSSSLGESRPRIHSSEISMVNLVKDHFE